MTSVPPDDGLDDLSIELAEEFESQDDGWQHIVAGLEEELANCDDPAKLARTHYQLALVSESVGDTSKALSHYDAALDIVPDDLVCLRGARRLRRAVGDVGGCLDLLEPEIHATGDVAQRARLLYLRGRLLEKQGDADGAVAAYAMVLELEADNHAALRASIRCARAAESWHALDDLYARAASAASDARLRAAYLVERGALKETKLEDLRGAAEQYEAALEGDPAAPGAVVALERIYAHQEHWAPLVRALVRAAERTVEPLERATLLYRSARLQRERLRDRDGALKSLLAAQRVAPDFALVLEELVEIYRELDDKDAHAATLAALVAHTKDEASRCALLHSLGRAHETRDAVEEAIRCYQDALAIDPTYIPALQALGVRLAERERWRELIEMHLGEAAGATDSERRASAHVRVAEIFERSFQDAKQAAAHYDKALSLCPANPASFKALLRLLAQAKEYRRLAELYERAAHQAKDDERRVSFLFKIGALWEDRLDDPEQAAHAYRRILKIDPEDLGAIQALQRVAEVAGNHRELVAQLRREAEICNEPALAAGLLQRAGLVLDEQLGDSHAATQVLLQVLEIDPLYVPALAALGRIYHRSGRWNELLRMYRQELSAIGDARQRATLLVKMGELCERRLGDMEQALTLYREAVEADGSYLPSRRALSRCLEVGGHFEELASLWEAGCAHQTSTDRAMTRYRIAELQANRLGALEPAIENCRKSLAEAPEIAAPVRQLLELLLARVGRWSELDALLGERAAQPGVPFLRARLRRDFLGDDEQALDLFAEVGEDERVAALRAKDEIYSVNGDGEGVVRTNLALSDALGDSDAGLAAIRSAAEAVTDGAQGDAVDPAALLERITVADPSDVEVLGAQGEAAAARGDLDALQKSYGQVASISDDPTVAADAWLRLGLRLDRSGDPRCERAYRKAVAANPALLAAVIGVGLAARRSGHHAIQAAAFRHEAELRGDRKLAAELLVEAASVLLEADIGHDQAIADLKKALDRDPDNAAAAELLIRCLEGRGEHQQLVELLARVAQDAVDPARKAALWMRVGEGYAGGDDPGAAIAALRRGLEAYPDNQPLLLQLVALYCSENQWAEAVSVMEEVTAIESDEGRRCELLLGQARIWGRRLGNPQRALACVEEILVTRPDDHATLALAAELRLKLGYVDEARATAEALMLSASDDVTLAEATALAAKVALESGDIETGEERLVEAVTLLGVKTDAYEMLLDRAQRNGKWQAVAGALDSFLRRGREDGAVDAARALADIYASRMELPRKAIDLLREGAQRLREPALLADAVAYLRKGGELDQAATALRELLRLEPKVSSHWRALVEVYEQTGDRQRLRWAMQARAVTLGVDASAARVPSVQRARLNPESAGLPALRDAGILDTPFARYLAVVGEAVGKAFELSGPEVSRRDRLQSRRDYPGVAAIDLALFVTGASCEVYVVPGLRSAVEIGFTSPPTVAVSDSLAATSDARQVFVLTRAFALVAAELHPLLELSPEQLGQIVEAAKSSDSELHQRLLRALPRRSRKLFDSAAAEVASAPVGAHGRWRAAVLRTVTRIAALVSDDATAAAAELAPDEAADLAAFWLSDEAMALRSALGIH